MKKLSESSRPVRAAKGKAKPARERIVSVPAQDFFHKPLTAEQRAELRKLNEKPDSEIDFTDIPALTKEQLDRAIQPNLARKVVGVRLDVDVLYWLKNYGAGHTTRINKILRAVMESEQRKEQRKKKSS